MKSKKQDENKTPERQTCAGVSRSTAVIGTLSGWRKLWIWLWYNDITRFFFIFIPTHFIATLPLMLHFNCHHEVIRFVLITQYIALFSWAMIDNDYSNLRKIGLDEYRNKLKTPDNCR